MIALFLSHGQYQIQQRKGFGELSDFPTPYDPHFDGSWDKSKNLYPLRNCIIPNLATMDGPRTTRPQAAWFLVPDGCLIGDYNAVSQWRWVLAIIISGLGDVDMCVDHHVYCMM